MFIILNELFGNHCSKILCVADLMRALYTVTIQTNWFVRITISVLLSLESNILQIFLFMLERGQWPGHEIISSQTGRPP